MKAKRDIQVMVKIGHGQPTTAQLAAWDRAWKLLLAMPAPIEAKPAAEEVVGKAEATAKNRTEQMGKL